MVKYGDLNPTILSGSYELCCYDAKAQEMIYLDDILRQEGLDRDIFDLCRVNHIYNDMGDLYVDIDINRAAQILKGYEVEI